MFLNKEALNRLKNEKLNHGNPSFASEAREVRFTRFTRSSGLSIK